MQNIFIGIIGAVALTWLGIAVFLKVDPRQLTCEIAQNGVWATNGEKCITESCYESGTCGLRSFPAAHCGDVVIGDRISRVLVHLGDPMFLEGDQLKWHWDKVSHGVGVEAQFREGILISLDCRAFPIAK